MAIQPFNYAALGPANMGQTDVTGSFMKGLQAGSMPKDIKQKQQQQELANALAQIQNQYQPQMNDAKLAQQGAQTNLTNTKAEYLPLQSLIQASNSQRANDRFGGAYQLNKALQTMPPAQRAAWMAQNPEAYTAMINQIGNNVLTPDDDHKEDLLANELHKLFGGGSQGGPPGGQMGMPQSGQMGAPNDSLTIKPEDFAKLANLPGASMGQGQPQPGMTNQNQQLPVNQDMAAQFSTSPEQVEKLRTAAELSANKALVTTKTWNQLEGALQLEDFQNDPLIQDTVSNASLYAGAVGKGKAAVSALSQKNPKAYEDYLSVVNQIMPSISNRIKGLEAMGATDAQRDELNGMWKKTMNLSTSNPEQFIQQYNKLGEAMARVGKAVKVSASPIFEDNRLKGFEPIGGDKPDKKTSDSSSPRKFNPATGRIE